MRKLGGIGAVVLAGGLIAAAAIGIGVVSAQSGPEEDKGRWDRYQELLAAELGVSVDELEAAQTAARNKLLDELVASGDLSAERAERLKQLEPGEGLHVRIWAHGLAHKAGGILLDILDTTAEVVGVPADELRERLRNGESLAEIAAAEGKDEETLKNELIAAFTEKISQAVEDGDISQELADRLIDHLDELAERAVDAEVPGFLREFRFEPRGERFWQRFWN